MGQALTWLAEQQPDAVAVSDDERTLTRAELDRAANRLARVYAEQGVRQDDLMMLVLPNGVDLLVASAAAWKVGAVPTPVSVRMPVPERSDVVAVAQPRLVVGAEPQDHPGTPTVGGDLAALSAGRSAEPLPPKAAGCWKAVLSGGSTGTPKVVLSTTPATIDPTGPPSVYIPAGGTQLVAGPMFHAASFTYATRGMLTGQRLVVLPRFDPARVLEEIARHRVTFAAFVPTMLRRILQLPAETRAAADLSSLVEVLHVGARCPEWLKREWIAWIGPERLLEVYGGSEALGVATIRGDEWLAHPGSVGRPLGDSEFRIVGPDGADVPVGEVGEILARRTSGASTYRYLGAPSRWRDDGWDASGDLGRLDAGGYLYVLDRVDDMIITGGANVFPAEVEGVLDGHPGVRTSVAFGLSDPDLGQRVHAVVELADPAVTPAELLGWAGERLDREKVPRAVEIVDGPLRNEAGKVRRKLLRAEREVTAG
ncbi:AMP-binding protein [Pseudonocardia sp. NPDC049154]|uniref:AMP-binding protein n=1 Tax=Pseudonocardia sp. NPDC049154 TaxID=3155501 RepID=UPI0033FE1048